MLSWDEAVRKRPAMYFGVGREHPELPTRIVAALMVDALHHRDGEHGQARVEVVGELRFGVVDDQVREMDGRGVPRLDHLGSLVDRRRSVQAAATALCARMIIEVWVGGRGFRQELAGMRPLAPPQEVASRAVGGPEGNGTLATYELDLSYFPRGAVVAASFEGFDMHGEWGAGRSGGGSGVVKDLRQGGAG
ncbi:hypothetical protein [Nonomuraea fuscirosea]|uniref:hypothetical protein n=1 Tax=Nonomuraea fuscirosea TaxID=1291556 RepID=UPI003429D7BB